MPMCVATLIGDSLMVDQVYRSCMVTIPVYDIWKDFFMHNMINFHAI